MEDISEIQVAVGRLTPEHADYNRILDIDSVVATGVSSNTFKKKVASIIGHSLVCIHPHGGSFITQDLGDGFLMSDN